MSRIFSIQLLILAIINFENVLRPRTKPIAAASSLTSPAGSIAAQLGFGAKRTVHYLNTLLEACDNVDDLNNWILFMDVGND